MPSAARPSAPTRTLALLGGVLALVGVVLLALGAAGYAGRLSGDLVGFTQGQQVAVPDSGMSVWSRSADARAGTVCTLDGQPLLRPVDDFVTEVGGSTFHEVARTPDGLAAGTYAVDCGADAFYAGPYGPRTVAPEVVGSTGLVLAGVLLPLALVCGLLALAARRRGRPVEAGPDPAAYTLSAQQPGPAASPWAAPGASAAPQGQAPGATVSTSAAPAAEAPPTERTDGPSGLPPAPVSTGHDATGAPDGREAGPAPQAGPPAGPRYELPPPS